MTGNSPITVNINISLLAAAALCLVPVVLVVLRIRQRMTDVRSRSEHPFKELRRRPAGETLRMKIVELDEQINDRIYLLVSVPSVLAATMIALNPLGLVAAALLVVLSVSWTFVIQKKLWSLLNMRRNYQLGFDGERYVAEELSRLIAKGFEIYHDVPFDNFNVDHVLVGPQGVFAIECKAKRKPIGEDGRKKAEIIFDGTNLHLPWGAEYRDIQQAYNNAETLSKWLTSAVGSRVTVSPILTLPGWFIHRKASDTRVRVLNPNEIFYIFDSNEVKLEPSHIKQICHHLDEQCRIEII